MKKTVIISLALTVFAFLLSVTAALTGRANAVAGDERGQARGDDEAAPVETPPSPTAPVAVYDDGNTTLRLLDGDAVTVITMERYLTGVVAAEEPASFEREALRAQAVAARTDTLYTMTVSPKARHPQADMCTDPGCCEAYADDSRLRESWGGDYAGNLRIIESAVHDTDGVYMTYAGEPILAVFHSSSSGRTEDCGDVWGGGKPYLVSVETPETAEDVPGFVSSVTVSAADFAETVKSEFPDAVLGGGAIIGAQTYSAGGRLLTVDIGGVTVKGTRLRAMFGLRSTAVSIEITDSDIVFTTEGYGHGVGMSQYGANVLAKRGVTFRAILEFYYTGVSFSDSDGWFDGRFAAGELL